MRRTSLRTAQLGLIVVLTLTLFMASSGFGQDPDTGSNVSAIEFVAAFSVAPPQSADVVLHNPCRESVAKVDLKLSDALTGVVQRSHEGTLQPGQGHRTTLFEGPDVPATRRHIRLRLRTTCNNTVIPECPPTVEIVEDATGETIRVVDIATSTHVIVKGRRVAQKGCNAPAPFRILGLP